MKCTIASTLTLALCLAATAGQAQQPSGDAARSFDALSARLEQQNQQIQQLQSQIANMQQGAPAPAGAPGAAMPPAAPAPVEVGSNMTVTARFYNGEGLMFETPNKDFTFHLGGWAQWDNAWWNQSLGMNVAPTAQAAHQGVASGGVGSLQDGDYWRRVRIVMEGTFWETYEYRWNFAPENNSFNTIGLDEFWVGDNKIPFIGTIRAGHVKTPMGFEGDMTSSSRHMTFMERSSYSEAIELNQNFGTGLWFGNSFLDDRGTWSAAIFRPDNANSSDYFGTGFWGAQGRFTCLPIYEDEGRHLLHLGFSSGWRNGTNSTAGGPGQVDLRARPELRDDDPAGAGSPPAGAAANTYLPDSNSNRMIDTGKLNVVSEYIVGTEMLYIRGPWSLQAEYGWNMVYGQTTVGGTGPLTYYVFNGGYVQAAYTLTGENRSYDKKYGTLGRYYFGGQGPYENAFVVRDADGNICSGHGGVELAARFTYTDLNAGPDGAARVNGGIMNGLSLGLNWYLNTNLTVNTEWVYNSRYDLPGNGNPNNPGTTTVVGDTSGFGTRVQLSF